MPKVYSFNWFVAEFICEFIKEGINKGILLMPKLLHYKTVCFYGPLCTHVDILLISFPLMQCYC